MATNAEISKIARLLWAERGKPGSGLSEFRDQAKQLLDDRDAICCPVQYTASPSAKRTRRETAPLSLAGVERSESWPRRSAKADSQVNAAGCDPAAEAGDISDCLDAIDAALASARGEGNHGA